MKQIFKYFVVGFFCITIGICGTIVVYHRYGNSIPSETVQTVNEVNIHETNTIKSAIDKIYDAVMVVQSTDARGGQSSGTGFVYKKDDKYGYVLTNHHVIEDAVSIKLLTSGEKEIEATLLGSDEYSDVAVLAIDVSEVIQVAILGDSSELELGDTLFTVGSPLGSKYIGTVTKGILSGKDRKVETDGFIMDVLQTDAAINPGNSGGPLLNINGEVIGITSMKMVEDEIEGMGFAIPIEIALSEVEKLEKGQEIVRPVLGVQIAELDNPYLKRSYQIEIPSNVENGVVIINVEDNSIAKDAGLQRGDIITYINDQKIESVNHFKYILYQQNIGDTISIRIIRNGNEKTLKVVLV